MLNVPKVVKPPHIPVPKNNNIFLSVTEAVKYPKTNDPLILISMVMNGKSIFTLREINVKKFLMYAPKAAPNPTSSELIIMIASLQNPKRPEKLPSNYLSTHIKIPQ